MKIEKEETINRSFVLTDNEIERITKRFDDSDYFVFKAICADKVIREFASIADLVQFENSPNKEIESLGITVFSKNHEKNAFIYFSKGSVDNIRIRLEGEEKDVLDLMEFLHERLYAMGTWYAFIARLKYSGSLINIIISWIFVIPLFTTFSRQYTKSLKFRLWGNPDLR